MLYFLFKKMLELQNTLYSCLLECLIITCFINLIMFKETFNTMQFVRTVCILLLISLSPVCFASDPCGNVSNATTAWQRQVFALSWLANGAGIHHYDKEKLQHRLDESSQYIGQWTVEWGPVIINDTVTHLAENTLFVAKNTAGSVTNYVVAMAGTNPKSFYDWYFEDWDITPEPWPYLANNTYEGNQIVVTKGDLLGLKKIFKMKYKHKLFDKGITVHEFLASIKDKENCTISFTGHSLGGALSPMMTLAFMDPNSTLNKTQGIADISAKNWKSVYLLATAGPSPGNTTFKQYFFDTTATAGNWKNDILWNCKDVVPHAWMIKTMEEISEPSFYNITFGKDSVVLGLIHKAQDKAKKYDYQQLNTTPLFKGELRGFKGILWTPDTKYLAQLADQHVHVYVGEFGIGFLSEEVNSPDSTPEEYKKVLSKLTN
jgi:hypothetical protein